MSTQALTATSVLPSTRSTPLETFPRPETGAASRTVMLEHAHRQIAAYKRTTRASPAAIANSWLALTYFVSDGGATPQIGLDGEGGIEIEWLADGLSLVVNAFSDGGNMVWSLLPDGQIPFRSEFTPRFMSGTPAIRDAEDFLKSISTRVSNRVTG